MDEEQDFAYAVSAKALGHIAETAGRQASGVVAIRSRSAAVTDGLALDVQQRAAEAIDAMVEPEGLDISVTIEDLAVLPAE